MDNRTKIGIRPGRYFSRGEREKIIKEYLSGNYTKRAIWKKHTGQMQEHGSLLRWMRQLGYISNENSIEKRNLTTLQHKESLPLATTIITEQATKQLENRIKELEKELELAQLKEEGYELMIQLAEKEFKISIRKKSSTK